MITSEDSEIVKKRMEKLKINDIFIDITDKEKIYETLKEKYSLSNREILYCGDDINDLPLMKKAGFNCAPMNAQSEVKRYCDFISTHTGGNGFVRHVCNLLLKQGSFKSNVSTERGEKNDR